MWYNQFSFRVKDYVFLSRDRSYWSTIKKKSLISLTSNGIHNWYRDLFLFITLYVKKKKKKPPTTAYRKTSILSIKDDCFVYLFYVLLVKYLPSCFEKATCTMELVMIQYEYSISITAYIVPSFHFNFRFLIQQEFEDTYKNYFMLTVDLTEN